MFQWTESKNEANKQKHGIYLSEVSDVFNDPYLVEFYDAAHSSMNEDRFINIGYLEGIGVLFVVTTDNTDGSKQIISARKAEPKEKKAYYENFRREKGGNQGL